MLIKDEMDRLVMIPGPSPVGRIILDALSQPTVAHTSAALAEIIRRCQDGLRFVAGTTAASPFLFAGSGTLAQEAAVVNLVRPGERLLVISNGYFGDRFTAIGHAHGIEVDAITAPWGTSVSPEQVQERLTTGRYMAATITHVDTSTGVAAPVPDIARVLAGQGVLTILDSVCALGGMPVQMDEWGVDVVLTGAQKALGVPPGLSLLLASDRALERRRVLGQVNSFYADFLNWEASMADPQVYFSTHPVNLFYALDAGLEIVQEEGLEQRFARHQRLATGFRAGMAEMGFSPFTEPNALAPTLSVVEYPAGIDDTAFRSQLAQQGVIAAGCLGDFKGKGVRFGHMGNITEVEIVQTLIAVANTITALNREVDAGAAVRQALSASAPRSEVAV